jgi:hypothetical protein
MRLAGIIAMLRNNTGYLAPRRIAPGRQHHRPQPRSRARETPAGQARVRPGSAAGTNSA